MPAWSVESRGSGPPDPLAMRMPLQGFQEKFHKQVKIKLDWQATPGRLFRSFDSSSAFQKDAEDLCRRPSRNRGKGGSETAISPLRLKIGSAPRGRILRKCEMERWACRHRGLGLGLRRVWNGCNTELEQYRFGVLDDHPGRR